MKNHLRGQKSKLDDLTSEKHLQVSIRLDSLSADVSCFGLDAQGKLSDDRYFIFYNQPRSPEGAICMAGHGFEIHLTQVPPHIERLVFTATLEQGTMSQLSNGHLSLFDPKGECARFEYQGRDFGQEKALMIAELYRKEGWRFGAIGQGFNGGLKALLESFGGEALDEPSVSPAPGPGTVSLVKQRRVDLDKQLAQKEPHLVSLIKKAQVSLDKKGLSDHRAKVALCLDISASMSSLYQSGKIQRLAEKVLALGTRFDDDFSIDIFLFGQNAHEAGSMSPDNFHNFIVQMLERYPLEGGTHYGKAMDKIRRFYNPKKMPWDLPTYVLFLTDGDAHDKDFSRKQITEASHEAIFWQFVGIGASKKGQKKGFFSALFSSDFSFLEELDDMTGRFLDNADFFCVEDPEHIADEELYESMLAEYPGWLSQAKEKRLI
ncbi:MAG: VWA domain-containing protein [Deinococcaceae bacterium]